jgi:hypothetical protein
VTGICTPAYQVLLLLFHYRAASAMEMSWRGSITDSPPGGANIKLQRHLAWIRRLISQPSACASPRTVGEKLV